MPTCVIDEDRELSMADAGVVVVGAGLGAIRLAENLRTGGGIPGR